MENHSIDNIPTASLASQHADIPQPTTLTTVEDQEDGGYKYPDVGTILSLNSIREVVNLIEQGVPADFIPGLAFQANPSYS
jgi:hypothetical protein